MRASIACMLICAATVARSAESVELPNYFQASFDAVAAQPLTIVSGSLPQLRSLAGRPAVDELPKIMLSGIEAPQSRPVLRPTAAAYASLAPQVGLPLSPGVPLPIRRPKGIDMPLVQSEQVAPPLPETKVAMLGTQPGAGLAIAALARLEPLAPIARGACSVKQPYRVSALGPGGRTAMHPSATLDVDMVGGLVRWEAGMQEAAKATLGEPIVAIHVAASYDCRTMNHRRRARLSEHARANAMDVSEFTTASGKRITVKADTKGNDAKAAFIKAVRSDTCDIFQVVLGPGSDGMHEDHIHMDLGRWKSCR